MIRNRSKSQHFCRQDTNFVRLTIKEKMTSGEVAISISQHIILIFPKHFTVKDIKQMIVAKKDRPVVCKIIEKPVQRIQESTWLDNLFNCSQ